MLTSLVVGCPPQEWVDAGSSSPDKVKATSFFALQEMQEKEKGELPPSACAPTVQTHTSR